MNPGPRNRGNVKCFLSKMLKTGEMLNMLNVFGAFLAQLLPNRGHMLNMLNVLNVLGEISQKGQTFNIFNISPVLSIFNKKHLTFPLFREPMSRNRGNVKCFCQKCLKQGKC